MTQCDRCGTPLEPEARFCPSCGARVMSAAGVDTAAPGRTSPALPGPPLAPLAPGAEPGYSTTAIVSLVLGILSWFGLLFLGAAGAVICGHLARREIRASGGRLKGDGLALGGLILGYVHLALSCIAVGIVILVLGGITAFLAKVGAH